MKEAVAVLVRAREMVAEGWVQGTGYVRDEDGVTVRRCAGQAIQDAYYDAVGVEQATQSTGSGCMCGGCPTVGGDLFKRVMWEFQRTIDSGNIPSWNDTAGRKKGEVLAAFDRTIERLRERQAKIAVVPEKIEVTWEPITIPAPEPKVIPVLVKKDDEPVGLVKKVLASIGV